MAMAWAISVEAHTALLVFSLGFLVASPVTQPGYAPDDIPWWQTNILRNSVSALPAIALAGQPLHWRHATTAWLTDYSAPEHRQKLADPT